MDDSGLHVPCVKECVKEVFFYNGDVEDVSDCGVEDVEPDTLNLWKAKY